MIVPAVTPTGTPSFPRSFTSMSPHRRQATPTGQRRRSNAARHVSSLL